MKIAVIGAGIAGLVAARRLALGGADVDVYERWPGLGGQVATMPVEGGDRLEHYYHHLFTTDREIVALYEELGMGGEIEWLPSSMAIFRDGASHAFTSPLDLLRFRPMSLLGRLRMGAGALALATDPVGQRGLRGPQRALDGRALDGAGGLAGRLGTADGGQVRGPLGGDLRRLAAQQAQPAPAHRRPRGGRREARLPTRRLAAAARSPRGRDHPRRRHRVHRPPRAGAAPSF